MLPLKAPEHKNQGGVIPPERIILSDLGGMTGVTDISNVMFCIWRNETASHVSVSGLFLVRKPVADILIKSHAVKTIVEQPVYPVVIIICAERDFFQ